jgi:hypothetical protein
MDRMQEPLDVAIVGAGIAGVISLHYARRAGLSAQVLERQGGVGGLWRQLPAWQDIQIGMLDWALGDLPLESPLQPGILANIQAWVDRFGLADGISLSTEVRSARHDGQCWRLDTSRGPLAARHLVCATGAHNKPVVPPVARQASTVRELHSSELRDPSRLDGARVLVVGGGGSAFDLLELALERAAHVTWVHRGVKWFMPTRKPKTVAGSVRDFARLQASGMDIEQQNAAINADMRGRYEKFGLAAILPKHAFDVRQDQLMPGRPGMIQRFASIDRHEGSVERIDGPRVTLTDGTGLEPDMLLWGTGYAPDLGFLDVEPLRGLRVLNHVAARCGGGFRSLDAPDLYILGVGLDGIGSAPWAYSLMARSLMSHVRGLADLGLEPLRQRINHFDLVDFLAARDPHSYPEGWRDAYRKLALDTPDTETYPIP